jgi:N-dimethylarginine dimethylaminohydrolase
MRNTDTEVKSSFSAAAYGGENWVARETTHEKELGSIWERYRVKNEFASLEAVLMHRPGEELAASRQNAESALMLAPLDIRKAQRQHDGIVDVFRQQGITVHLLEPEASVRPNQMFCADLCAMTPQGVILARPAGRVRAGEERPVARRLADLGVPILRMMTGDAVFEGADLMWLDGTTAIVGRGHRTNQTAIVQIMNTMAEIDCDVIPVDLPYGTMHLMGMMRIADADLAFCWPRRTPVGAVNALRDRGYQVAFPPLTDDPQSYRAMNFVTIEPRKILLASGSEKFQQYFESFGINVLTTEANELAKAAGNIGCLTCVLSRN